MGYRSSKKGNVVMEVITIIVALFIFAIIAVSLNSSQQKINEDIQNDTSIPNMSKALMEQNTNDFPIIFDSIFIFILISLWIITLVAAALTDTSYIFLIVAILLLITALVLVGILSNSYEEIRTDSDLITSGDMFPKTNYVFEHLGLFATFFGLSVCIALFGKWAGR